MKSGFAEIKDLSPQANEIIRKAFNTPETNYITTKEPTVDNLGLGEFRIYNDGTNWWLYTRVSKTEIKKIKFNMQTANIYPQRATMWHAEANIISGNALTAFATTETDTFSSWFQNPSANGNSFSNSFFLKAGTYTFFRKCIKASSSGKLDWTVDGISILSGDDFYASSAVFNSKTTTNITIAEDGYHKIVGTVNGKNASSDGYAILLSRYGFYPATDPARE